MVGVAVGQDLTGELKPEMCSIPTIQPPSSRGGARADGENGCKAAGTAARFRRFATSAGAGKPMWYGRYWLHTGNAVAMKTPRQWL